MKDKFKLIEVPGDRDSLYEYFKSDRKVIEPLPKLN